MKIDVENPQAVLEDILTRMNKGELVEVKHGVWKWDDDEHEYHCSVCGKHAYGNIGEILSGNYQFCPYCGAKVDWVDDGEEKTDETN